MKPSYCSAIPEENEPLNEIAAIQNAATLTPEEIKQAIILQWDQLQQVPSYIENQIEANRDLIEVIATWS